VSVAKIVNLNRARKAKRRADDEAQAAANRAAFGRTKAEKLAAKAEGERSAAVLNGVKRSS
jgi:hypothetical protein